MTGEKETLETELAGVQSDLTTALAEADGLREDIADLEEEKADLISDRDTLQAQVNEDTATIADLRDQITSLESQISTKETQIVGMESQIADLTAQNTALQEALDNASSSGGSGGIPIYYPGDGTGKIEVVDGNYREASDNTTNEQYEVAMYSPNGEKCYGSIVTIDSTLYKPTNASWVTIPATSGLRNIVNHKKSHGREYVVVQDSAKKIIAIYVYGKGYGY